MQTQTLYVHRDLNQSGKINWRAESYESMKRMFSELGEGCYKLLIQKMKNRSGGWRYKYHFGHVLPLIVEYMNRNNINGIIDPGTGETIPMDVDTLHEYHKSVFNPGLLKNILNRKDARGNVPEFIPVAISTTKLSDGDFISRYEDEIMAVYANNYGIEFISRDDFRTYFEEGKDSKMIIDLQMQNI